MARIAMVTRTMVTTKAKVLCLNIEKSEPFETELTLAGTFKDNKSLMKAVSAKVDSETVKAVHVKSTEEVETLYGMTEDNFIKNAEVLPARGTEPAKK